MEPGTFDDGARMNESYQRTQEEIARMLRERDAAQDLASVAGANRASSLPVMGGEALRDFESSSSPIRIFDLETLRYLAVNAAAVRFYGYTREEFLDLTIADTRHPDERAELAATVGDQTGYLRHRPARRQVKKSGETVIVERITQDVLFEGRRARLSLTIDVTGRLHMQELIWRRQQEFERLAENLPDLVARFDRSHRFVYVNSAVEKLLGLPRHAMIGRTQRELGMPEDLAARFGRSLDEAADTGESHTLEFSIATARGDRLFEAFHIPERDSGGQITAVLCVAHDVTERKEADDEVRRQKNLLAAIIDNLPVGVVIRDAKTLRYVLRNRFLEELHGHPLGAAIGKTVYDVFPKEQADHSVATDRAAIQSHKLVEIPELEMPRDSGERRTFHVRKVPLLDDAGQPKLLLGIVDDITDRKRAEQALRQAEERFDLAFDSTGLGMWDWNVRTSEVWRHPRWSRMLGYEPDEIRAHICMWREFCHPDDWEAAQAKLLAHMEGVAPDYAAEYRMRRKDGTWLWVICRGKVIERDSAGAPLRMIGYIQDITVSKQAERALRESEERFRQLAENIRQVFWMVTADLDRLIYVSPAYEEIWGKTRASLYQNPRGWMDSVHPEDYPRVKAGADGMAHGRPLDVEYRIVRPDSTVRWMRDRSYPMNGGDGPPLVCGISEDITDIKLAEQEKLTHAIHQRDALVREVHHRIKNSLQGVAGLLRQKMRQHPAIAPSIEEAIAQLQSVALVYGLQETRTDGQITLAEIVEEVCVSAEGLTGGHVKRTLKCEKNRPTCIAGSEAVSVAVALNELVFNALKHQRGAGDKQAQVTLVEAEGVAEIRITNRGKLPRGFNYSAGSAVGHGLGLVRTLLASPGGSVTFNGARKEVEVVLKLRPPLLAERQRASSR
jgi:PAS domain S-box-containing protein